MENKELKSKLLPLVLTIVVIVLDQITKMLICRYLPLVGSKYFDPSAYYAPFATVNFNPGEYHGSFLEIIHIRNTGVAFSFGDSWPLAVRRVAFSFVPIVVLCLVLVVYFRNKEFTKTQRWAIAGIVGGGFGNIIDRLFRPLGVVDFIDVKWFGLKKGPSFLRMVRWPTFNVADAAVVVCGILLVISFIAMIVNESKAKKESQN